MRYAQIVGRTVLAGLGLVFFGACSSDGPTSRPVDETPIVVVSFSSVTLAPGAAKSIGAAVIHAADTRVSYRSSDTTVVSVSPDGTMTARREGEAVITVTTVASPQAHASVAVTVRAPPTFTVSARDTTVVKTNIVKVPVVIHRSGDLSLVVYLSLVSAPSGVSGTFDRAFLAGRDSIAMLTLSASEFAAPGRYVVRAATELETKEVSAQLAMTTGSFTIWMPQNFIAIKPGETQNFRVNIIRSGGFNGTVQIGLAFAPVDSNLLFIPPDSSGGFLKISVPSFRSPQATSAEVTYSAFGLPTGSVPITVEIR